jgi:hypothetical protein
MPAPTWAARRTCKPAAARSWRRHLHESQRAMVGAKLENMKQGRPGKDANLHGISHDDAADLLNISKQSIATARKLLDSETAEPELIEAVEPGERAGRAWGKLSVTLTDGLTRIKSRCYLRPSRWSLAFRETWILAGGVSRNSDPGCRARVGWAPPLFPPHVQPTRPSANSCLEFLASKSAAPASPIGARPFLTVAAPPVGHGRPGSDGPDAGLRDGVRAALHTWSWGRLRSCARANRKAAQDF